MNDHFALGKHITFTLDDFTCEEFEVLKLIETEISEHQKEQDQRA